MRQEWADIHDARAAPGVLLTKINHAISEDALLVHEVFADTVELRLHLSRGTAAKNRHESDQIAVPECSFFRGPDIRTGSRFLSMPATCTRLQQLTRPGGSMSEGLL